MQTFREILRSFPQAARSFIDDGAPMYAAALAYYAIFSIIPLLLLAILIAGSIIGRSAAQSELLSALSASAGPEVALFVDEAVARLVERTSNRTLTIISIITLLIGASAVFAQLQMALDQIWEVEIDTPKGLAGVWYAIRSRSVAFVMIFIAGGMLVVSVLVDLALNLLRDTLQLWLPDLIAAEPLLDRAIGPFIMFVAIFLILKTLPRAKADWRIVVAGSLVTTVFGVLAVWVLGWVLAFNKTPDIFGAAGSLIVLVIWIYVLAQILLYGAEYTKVLGERVGKPIQPERAANKQSANP